MTNAQGASDSPDSAEPEGGSNKSNAGTMAGAVVGVVAAVALLAVAALYYVRRGRPNYHPVVLPSEDTVQYEPTEEVQVINPYIDRSTYAANSGAGLSRGQILKEACRL